MHIFPHLEKASFEKGLNDAFRTHKIDDKNMSRLMQSYFKTVTDIFPGHCFSSNNEKVNVRLGVTRIAKRMRERYSDSVGVDDMSASSSAFY